MIGGILQFPYDVVHVLRHPMTSVNLYVSRVDVTFDDFRVTSESEKSKSSSRCRKRFGLELARGDEFLAGALPVASCCDWELSLECIEMGVMPRAHGGFCPRKSLDKAGIWRTPPLPSTEVSMSAV